MNLKFRDAKFVQLKSFFEADFTLETPLKQLKKLSRPKTVVRMDWPPEIREKRSHRTLRGLLCESEKSAPSRPIVHRARDELGEFKI